MTRRKFIVPCIFAAIALHGCCNTPEKNGPPPLFAAPSLGQAALLEQRRDYVEALKQYREVQASAKTSEDFHMALMGQARCLAGMNNYPLALAALMPLDPGMKSPQSAERAAMAGEIMLCLGRTSQAEEVLYASVKSMPDDAPPSSCSWLAPACANLAVISRKNGNSELAFAAMTKAAVFFDRINRKADAEKCRGLAASITVRKKASKSAGTEN